MNGFNSDRGEAATARVNRMAKMLAPPPPPDITFTWEYITPDKASTYLAKNYSKNRKIKKNLMKRLTTALEQGWFYPTHQGLALSPEGSLLDGQNRLTAIRDSGISSWLIVARGVEVAHIEAVDRGAIRSDADNLRMITGQAISLSLVATAKAMYKGLSQSNKKRISDHPLHEFIDAHREALEFACSTQGNHKGLVAPLRAVIARAWYHENAEKLRKFLSVIADGVPENPAEASLVKLRDYVRDPRNVANTDMKNQVMRRTIYALKSYLNDKEFSRLIEWSGDDPWPLEDDEKDED
jgi:hypothetical protein